jgi:hypothetical protein
MIGSRLLITLALVAFLPAEKIRAAEVSAAAQSACLAAVNNQHGGSVRDLKIATTEFSQANSVLTIKAIGIRSGSQNESWKCLVSNRGTVEELSVISGGSAAAPAINRNYGGNIHELKVVGSTSAKPNFEVIVKAIGVRSLP